MKDIKEDDRKKDPMEQAIKKQTLMLPLIELDIANTLQSIYDITETHSHDHDEKA